MKGIKATINNVDWSSFTRNLLSLSGLDFNESKDKSSTNDISGKDDNPDDDGDQDDGIDSDGNEPI